MDLFHVETGAIPAHSCHEESVPMLQDHSSGKDGTSKAFLVHDSMACIANITLALGDIASTTTPGLVKDPGIKDKTSNTKNSLPNVLDYKPSKLTTPRSPEYRSLSPFNLEDPVTSLAQSSTKGKIAARSSEGETDCLLGSGELDQKEPLKHGILASSLSNNRDQLSTTIPSVVSIESNQPLNSSTSPPPVKNTMVSETSRSPEDKGKTKTLEELAKEWQAGQANQAGQASPTSQVSGPKEASKQLIESGDDEESKMLVRHSTYYSSSSAVSGMTSEEYKLRKKLKARLHLHDDDVNRVRSYGGQPLVKLARD